MLSFNFGKDTWKTAAVIVLAAGLGIWWIRRQAAEAGQVIRNDVLPALDPTSSDNIFNQAFNKTLQAITGDPQFNFGAWLYDVTHQTTLPPASGGIDPGQAAAMPPISQPPASDPYLHHRDDGLH